MKRGLIFCTVALFLVACSQGGTNKSPREGVMPGGPGAGFGPGISVDEALKSKLKEPLLVNGWLLSPRRARSGYARP
jgi:hypothetical protein